MLARLKTIVLLLIAIISGTILTSSVLIFFTQLMILKSKSKWDEWHWEVGGGGPDVLAAGIKSYSAKH